MASRSALVAIVERMKERLAKRNPGILKKPKVKRAGSGCDLRKHKKRAAQR
jgi:hypothetical protein